MQDVSCSESDVVAQRAISLAQKVISMAERVIIINLQPIGGNVVAQRIKLKAQGVTSEALLVASIAQVLTAEVQWMTSYSTVSVMLMS